MKTLLLCLFLVGCAGTEESRQETVNQELPKVVKKISTPKEPPLPIIKECDVEYINEVDDCTIYTLTCEDGSTEYYLRCTTQPIGVITNPPRPINYGNPEKR